MTLHAPGAEGLDPNRCIHQSWLSDYARSPSHCYERHVRPSRTVRSTDATSLGTLAHALVLEPEAFARRYRVAPTASRSSTEGVTTLIAWYAAVCQELQLEPPESEWSTIHGARVHLRTLEVAVLRAGVEVVPQVQHEQAQAIHRQVWASPTARRFLEHPQAMTEVPVVWHDDDGPHVAPCAGRIDILIPPCPDFPRGVVIDLKTSEDASPEAFLGGLTSARWPWSTVNRFKLHWQADFYRRAFRAIYGVLPDYAWFVAEKTAPFEVGLYQAPEWMFTLARQEYAPLLADMTFALATDTWPGYSADFVTSEPPPWLERRMK
jgi:exodeoxyribonuclease VIII